MPGSWTKTFHLLWYALFQVLNIEPNIRERWHCYNPSTTTPIFSLNIETFWWIWDSKDSLVIGSWLWLLIIRQGGRSWQPFGEEKNGQKSFRQAGIFYFCDKCVVFARNGKFGNSIQYNMQYVPCHRPLFAQETLFLTQRSTFLPSC